MITAGYACKINEFNGITQGELLWACLQTLVLIKIDSLSNKGHLILSIGIFE